MDAGPITADALTVTSIPVVQASKYHDQPALKITIPSQCKIRAVNNLIHSNKFKSLNLSLQVISRTLIKLQVFLTVTNVVNSRLFWKNSAP